MFSPDYRGSEFFGEEVLNLGVIAGAVFLLLASLWTGASPPAAETAQAQTSKQVVASAHPGRVS